MIRVKVQRMTETQKRRLSKMTTNTTGTNPLQAINQIVSVGSVDGVLTTAALLRLIGNPEVPVVFTQAFTVDKVDPTKWEVNRNVALVDLAVNNRDKTMTAAFIQRLRDAGHTIVAVIDEHSREDWEKVLGSFDGLIIEPQSQAASDDAPKSSGEVLRRALMTLGVRIGDMEQHLMDQANQADAMNFTGKFAKTANEAVKSAITDDSRRVHIARHYAQQTHPSEQMLAWMEEYKAILANHSEILAAKQELGDGIVRAVATDKAVDMTTLMSSLYRGGAKVVALEGEAFVPAKKAKEILIAYGTSSKELDLMAIIKDAGVNPLGGFAQKVNVSLEDEATATEAIRTALTAAG